MQVGWRCLHGRVVVERRQWVVLWCFFVFLGPKVAILLLPGSTKVIKYRKIPIHNALSVILQ